MNLRVKLPACALIYAVLAVAQPSVSYRADLTDLRDDKVTVEMTVPPMTEDEIMVAFPRIVPGIYGVMDHGRLASEPRAFDASGQPLPISRDGVNGWRIAEAKRLHRITYRVDDGWENFDILFEQGNFRSSEGTYSPEVNVVNHNALFAYIKGQEHLPCSITLIKSPTHYAATSLPRTSEHPDSVTFHAGGYRELVDNPMLVCAADTAHIRLPDIDVTVACYSTTGRSIAHEVAAQVRPLLLDQRAYLGGKLPVDHYTFLIYHNPSNVEGSSSGDGLEHSASTVILLCMPLDTAAIGRSVYGIASHEFFHTILPLSLHSEEIEHYDFAAPRMSRHLWLYEGMTEYFAIHMPVKQGRQSVTEFVDVLNEKIQRMRSFTDSVPLTTLSVRAMERQDQYYNFYLKGTLFCMGLDIALRERSNGAYGVQQLVQDLAKRYGVGRPFKDEELFAAITELTGPDVGALLQHGLNEAGPLPLEHWAAKVGLEFDPAGQRLRVTDKPDESQLRLRQWWIGR